jgi:hypothetical protein
MDDAYLKILQMIQDGTISAEEGAKLLDALGGQESEPADQPAGEASRAEGVTATAPVGPPSWARWAWVYPSAAGLGLLAIAGVFTGLVMRDGRQLGWLACTLPPMILGALVMALAWWSRSARWLHVRVRDGERHINISLPLPLRLAAWGMRMARPWVPQLQDTAVDELILSLAEVDSREGILAVEVNEGADEQVRVYLG